MNKCVDCFYRIESKNYKNTICGLKNGFIDINQDGCEEWQDKGQYTMDDKEYLVKVTGEK